MNNYKPNENVFQRKTYICQGIVKYVPPTYREIKVYLFCIYTKTCTSKLSGMRF